MEPHRGSGVLAGLACGDAVGRPVEFVDPAQIRTTHGRVTEMLANGSHGQPAGTITDDTELALGIAQSLVDEGRFDPPAVVDRFVSWYDTDPLSVGGLTSKTLIQLDSGGTWNEVGVKYWRHLPEETNAGNGSVMRCAPYGIAFASALDDLTIASRVSSALTHADPRCQWSFVILNVTIAGLLEGVDRPLQAAIEHAEAAPDEVLDAVRPISTVVYREIDSKPIDLENSGYVVTPLQAGLYFGLTAETVEDAIVDAVMLGGDTDTIGAIAGAVAGARFGIEGLPDRWLDTIDEIADLQRLGSTLRRNSFSIAPAAETVYKGGTFDL